MKNFFHTWTITACAFWLLTGCVRESVPPCVSDVEVTFRYVHNMSGRDLFSDQVHKVILLVFDSRGIYAGSYADQGAALASADYAMRLSLNPGVYTLLAWGGWMDSYDLSVMQEGISSLADFRLRANGLAARGRQTVDIPELDDLFHGIYGGLEVVTGQTARCMVDLVKDTKTIQVNVSGLEHLHELTARTSDPSPFDVEILADNGLYGADNIPLRGQFDLRYLPGSNVNTDYTLDSSTRTLRLMQGDQVRLRVTLGSTGRVICDDNLIDLIAQDPGYATQADIDRQDVFRFDYRIGSDATLTISVNGWTVVDAIPIL